jgi:hypothetical protein
MTVQDLLDAINDAIYNGCDASAEVMVTTNRSEWANEIGDIKLVELADGRPTLALELGRHGNAFEVKFNSSQTEE